MPTSDIDTRWMFWAAAQSTPFHSPCQVGCSNIRFCFSELLGGLMCWCLKCSICSVARSYAAVVTWVVTWRLLHLPVKCVFQVQTPLVRGLYFYLTITILELTHKNGCQIVFINWSLLGWRGLPKCCLYLNGLVGVHALWVGWMWMAPLH